MPNNKRQFYGVSSSIGAPQIINIIEVGSNKKKQNQKNPQDTIIWSGVKGVLLEPNCRGEQLCTDTTLLLLKQSSIHSFKEKKIKNTYEMIAWEKCIFHS